MKQQNRYFVKSNFVGVNRLFILVYSIQDLKLEDIIKNCVIKNYNVIINWKSFYDQPVDSDIKW